MSVPKLLKRFDSLEDVYDSFRDLLTALTGLDFAENFQGWIEEDLEIAASTTQAIRNRLRDGKIPRFWVILRQFGPSASLVEDSSSPWDEDFVYLRNGDGASAGTWTVLFLR